MAYYDDYDDELVDEILDEEIEEEDFDDEDFDDEDFVDEDFDDEDFDDEELDDEGLAERRRRRRRRRRRSRRRKVKPSGRTKRRSKTKVAQKPNRNYVTVTQLSKSLAPINFHINGLKRDHIKLTKFVNGIDRKYDSRTKVLDSRTTKNKKDIDKIQQNILMSTLFGGPKLQKITLKPEGTVNPDKSQQFSVTGLEQDNMMQMMMAMMGGGSLGKDNSMMPLILMAGQNGTPGTDNTLLMLMMMMNK